MSFYPPKIDERFSAPLNAGKIENADAAGTGASFVCGTFVKFFLQIDSQTGEIKQAKFKSNGCGYAVAAADVLTEMITGRRLTELHGFDKNFQREQLEEKLGVFADSRIHCAEICIDALQRALAGYRLTQIEEFAGEKSLICTCFGVSEETIEKLISDNYLETVEEVTDLCGAGGGCGSCRFLIQELIDIF